MKDISEVSGYPFKNAINWLKNVRNLLIKNVTTIAVVVVVYSVYEMSTRGTRCATRGL